MIIDNYTRLTDAPSSSNSTPSWPRNSVENPPVARPPAHPGSATPHRTRLSSSREKTQRSSPKACSASASSSWTFPQALVAAASVPSEHSSSPCISAQNTARIRSTPRAPVRHPSVRPTKMNRNLPPARASDDAVEDAAMVLATVVSVATMLEDRVVQSQSTTTSETQPRSPPLSSARSSTSLAPGPTLSHASRSPALSLSTPAPSPVYPGPFVFPDFLVHGPEFGLGAALVDDLDRGGTSSRQSDTGYPQGEQEVVDR